MSKAEQTRRAKQEQGYRETPDTCGNCAHYQSEVVEKTYDTWDGVHHVWTEEKKKRCSIGGFPVKKTATCDRYLRKENP